MKICRVHQHEARRYTTEEICQARLSSKRATILLCTTHSELQGAPHRMTSTLRTNGRPHLAYTSGFIIGVSAPSISTLGDIFSWSTNCWKKAVQLLFSALSQSNIGSGMFSLASLTLLASTPPPPLQLFPLPVRFSFFQVCRST
jgi:hypothetical protein